MSHPVVLVAPDGSPDALRALLVARRVADLRGAVLDIHDGDLADGKLPSAALIVMSARGTDLAAAPLAAVAQARCPVILINPDHAPESWILKRMLALHDGSPSISAALAPAAVLARQADADLVVLQVAHDAGSREPGSMAPPTYVDQVQHNWPLWSEEFLHRLTCHCSLADVRARVMLAQGEPAAETLRVAVEESADLIVLAWTGEGTDSAYLQALLRGARCPIMLTRAAS